MPLPLIIDCDTGRDDALTLALVAAQGLELHSLISSYGNTSLENVSRNNALLLSFLQLTQTSHYSGSAAPLAPHKAYDSLVLKRQAVNGNGLCNLKPPHTNITTPPKNFEDLCGDIYTYAKSTVTKLHYIIIGPATNAAKIVETLGKKAHECIAQFTMMGGKFSPLWEEMPSADFNCVADALAVRKLMESSIPLRFMPINISWPVALQQDEVEALIPQTPQAEFWKALMLSHLNNFATEPVFRFHDPCILLTLKNEQNYQPAMLDICLNEESLDYGRLISGTHLCEIYKAQNDYYISDWRKSILQHLGFL